MSVAPLPSPPRVLIVADNASAAFGGEAILPLKYFTLLARRGRDVRLITHARNRPALEAAFPDLAARVLYSPDTAAHRWLWRIGSRFPGAIRDHLFGNLMGLVTGWQQRRMAQALIRDGFSAKLSQSRDFSTRDCGRQTRQITAGSALSLSFLFSC